MNYTLTVHIKKKIYQKNNKIAISMGSMLELLSAKSTEYLVMTKTQTRIRSFVTQRAHITPRQARALQKLKPTWRLPYQDQPVDRAEVFGRDAPTSIEVGSGLGEATIEIAHERQSTRLN